MDADVSMNSTQRSHWYSRDVTMQSMSGQRTSFRRSTARSGRVRFYDFSAKQDLFLIDAQAWRESGQHSKRSSSAGTIQWQLWAGPIHGAFWPVRQ